MINLKAVLIGFFSKQFVLYSAIQSGYFFISIVSIIFSVISASYYLKIIRLLHEEKIENQIAASNKHKKFWEKEKIKKYFLKNSYYSVYNLRKGLLEKYANIKKTTQKSNNYQVWIHTNYFKEIQLIFILIFILKFDFIYKHFLNNKSNSLISLSTTKDLYKKEEFWQLNTLNYQNFTQSQEKNYLKKISNEIDISENKKFELHKNIKPYFFYKLSNYHSFLISNITLMILLFVINPSIWLSSIRLLSLSIFAY
jgi:hypothetical protein